MKTEAEVRAALDDLKWVIAADPGDTEGNTALAAEIVALEFVLGEERGESRGLSLSRFLDRVRNIRVNEESR